MTGAQFEISIDGVPRTYRDRKDYALEAAQFLKSRNPNSVVKLKPGSPITEVGPGGKRAVPKKLFERPSR